jgi:hypothetical protein
MGKLQRLGKNEEHYPFPNGGGDRKMIDVFTGLLLVALIVGGFLLARHLFKRRDMMNPPMELPWQSGYGPKDDYGRSVPPNRSYDGPGYNRPMYGPGYGDPRYGRPAYGPGYDPAGYGRPMFGPGYPQQTGISPWAAGGLGAVGGGLLGYELGRMAGEHEQRAQDADAGNPEHMATLDAEGYDPGMAGSVGSYDVSGFPEFGGDFGGGDFGGIEM